MRLWHQSLISLLPRQQLLGQHRECCALRGKGWGKKHATVNYVFNYELEFLVAFHIKVMDEMQARGYKVSPEWIDYNYRGKNCPKANLDEDKINNIKKLNPIYQEHNKDYFYQCIENLKTKNIFLKIK